MKNHVGRDRIRVRGYFIKNIIIHSVNNILILLSIINSVNVKNNNNNKLQIANRKNTYTTYLLFFTLTLFIIDSRIRILLTLCIIILSSNPNPIPTNAGRFRGGFFPLIDKVNWYLFEIIIEKIIICCYVLTHIIIIEIIISTCK